MLQTKETETRTLLRGFQPSSLSGGYVHELHGVLDGDFAVGAESVVGHGALTASLKDLGVGLDLVPVAHVLHGERNSLALVLLSVMETC